MWNFKFVRRKKTVDVFRRFWRLDRNSGQFSGRTVILLTLLALFHFIQQSDSNPVRKKSTVYWNSTNPIFRIDNTDHVLTVNILDRVNMICPYYDPRLFDKSQVQEISEIYRVPRWGYDNCELTKDAQIAGVCVTPNRRAKISIVFREFTPLPGGLEFRPGHAYYFISTSNGSLSGLSNRHGGLCRTKNMKLKVEILPSGFDAPSTKTPSPTPVMYIIHDRHPDDGSQELGKNPNRVHQGYKVDSDKTSSDGSDKEEDDDGGATSQSASAFLMICLLTAITILHLL